MKEIDDTPLTESESDQRFEHLSAAIDELNRQLTARAQRLEKRIICAELDRVDLDLRIANLETQRTPEMENDDPEWFS